MATRLQFRFVSSINKLIGFHPCKDKAHRALKVFNQQLALKRYLATTSVLKDDNKPTHSDSSSSLSYDAMLINKVKEDFTQNEGFMEDVSKSEPVSRTVLLNTALLYVDEFGWSVDAIRAASKQLGLSSNVETMFSRGGRDLVLHFIGECNSHLSDHLQSIRITNNDGSKDINDFLKNAIEVRLRMVLPHIKTWPSAMSLMLHPQNATEAVEYAANMVDEIWYHAGDASTDIDWYTRRIGLAAIYGATELHLTTDKSPDYKDTWQFLSNRLDNVQQWKQFQGMVDDACTKTYDGLSMALSTVRNLTRQ